jgi:hypothetical protein
MVMVRGRKTFHLISPEYSREVYGGSPLREAHFRASLGMSEDGKRREIEFSRHQEDVSDAVNVYSTYSPMNITDPGAALKFPLFRDVDVKTCDVNEGDAIFVPSNWWHEVHSLSDDEGKAIGVNIFFA